MNETVKYIEKHSTCLDLAPPFKHRFLSRGLNVKCLCKACILWILFSFPAQISPVINYSLLPQYLVSFLFTLPVSQSRFILVHICKASASTHMKVTLTCARDVLNSHKKKLKKKTGFCKTHWKHKWETVKPSLCSPIFICYILFWTC